VLLIHGFTGSPPEMRLLGEYLNHHGLTVAAPLLPGHGTQVGDMNRCRWRDWTAHAESALDDLGARCDSVFVGGLSMGALIALYLAAGHPEIQGGALYAPAMRIAGRLLPLVPVAKHFLRTIAKSGRDDMSDPQASQRLWGYDEYPIPATHELLKLTRRVRRLLPQVRCPLLIVHSTQDTRIRPDSAAYVYEHAGAEDKELLTLHNSGHALTVDSEWEHVAERTYRFIEAHS
jgi:carboxylesterase